MHVPKKAVGLVIGSGGSTLREIADSSNCKLDFDRLNITEDGMYPLKIKSKFAEWIDLYEVRDKVLRLVSIYLSLNISFPSLHFRHYHEFQHFRLIKNLHGPKHPFSFLFFVTEINVNVSGYAAKMKSMTALHSSSSDWRSPPRWTWRAATQGFFRGRL